MKSNVSTKRIVRPKTHEGADGEIERDPVKALERSVATCMLFENTYYEGGESIADRISDLCQKLTKEQVLQMAKKARTEFKLRHVPLFLIVQAAKKKDFRRPPFYFDAAESIQRPDEMTELLAIYWKAGRKPIPALLKKAIAHAFGKFDEYQLAKWNQDSQIKLRDALLLTHPKPVDTAQAELWKRLLDGKLATPDTWEVALTNAHTKPEKLAVWERLLDDRKLGDMAFIMNLRNMEQVGVPRQKIVDSMAKRQFARVFPWRFVTAAEMAPALAQDLSDAMVRAMASGRKFDGETHIIIDVSGSMDDRMASRSPKGGLSRWKTAAALAVLLRETGRCRVFTFSNQLCEVGNLKGLGLIDKIGSSQPHGSTRLGDALETWMHMIPGGPTRVIVITDEQTHDSIMAPPKGTKAYVVSVAPYKVGVETRFGWTRINGWSERVLDYIAYEEAESENGSANR